MESIIGIWRTLKDKLPAECFVSALVVLSFVYGVVIDSYKVFPYPLLRAAYDAANELWVSIEAWLPQEPETYSITSDWVHLSSARGDLLIPGESDQQTASLALDVDLDGLNDFVIAARRKVLSFQPREPALLSSQFATPTKADPRGLVAGLALLLAPWPTPAVADTRPPSSSCLTCLKT